MRTHPAFVRLLHVLALILLSGLFVLGTGCVHNNDPWYDGPATAAPSPATAATAAQGPAQQACAAAPCVSPPGTPSRGQQAHPGP